MMVFLFMYGLGLLSLARRFCHGSIFPVLFAVTSPAVMVSGNVMRDTPALGLATLGLALFVYGTDHDRKPYLFLGATLAGLAVLTKYSAIIMLPVLCLYPFFQKKYRVMVWVWPIFALIGLWCMHNLLMYGNVHMFFLAMQKHHMVPKPWQNKLAGGVMLFGAILYLCPLIFAAQIRTRKWVSLIMSGLVGMAAYVSIQWHHDRSADLEYLFWAVTGSVVLYWGLWQGISRGVGWLRGFSTGNHSDSLFLFAWLCAPVIFSVLFVPFQAVRHLLMAIGPLAMLVFRYVDVQREWDRVTKMICMAILLLQVGMGFAVHVADCDYADTYRDFVSYVKEHEHYGQEKIWYVGHWGFKFYADATGFQQVHYNGDFPEPGDLLLWPKDVHVGQVFMEDQAFLRSLELIESREIQDWLPIRTMNRNGAKFYATIWMDTPYRLGQTDPLETLRIYRVMQAYHPQEDGVSVQSAVE
jgi:hypothetical protein